jgi:hypothetical protein
VLAAAERCCEDSVELNFDDGSVDAESLRVSDFWATPAWSTWSIGLSPLPSRSPS